MDELRVSKRILTGLVCKIVGKVEPTGTGEGKVSQKSVNSQR